MRKKLLLVLLFFVLSVFALIMFGCKGDKGDTGATGPTGPAGTPGTPGDSIVSTTFQNGIYPSTGYTNIIDAYIGSDSNESTNTGTEDGLDVGFFWLYLPPPANITLKARDRTVIKIDTSLLTGQNITVKNAKLTLYVAGYYNTTTPTVQSLNIAAYKLKDHQFTESDVTWIKYDSSNNWTNQGGDFDITPISDKITITSEKVNTYVSLNLNPSIVQTWIDDPSQNKGIILIADEEGIVTNKMYYVVFVSSNYSEISKRPKLTVYYTLN